MNIVKVVEKQGTRIELGYEPGSDTVWARLVGGVGGMGYLQQLRSPRGLVTRFARIAGTAYGFTEAEAAPVEEAARRDERFLRRQAELAEEQARADRAARAYWAHLDEMAAFERYCAQGD